MFPKHPEPEALAAADHRRPSPALRIVPGVPHVDDVADTAPPWTVPTTPNYAVDPHFDALPGFDADRALGLLTTDATAKPRSITAAELTLPESA